MIWGLTLIDILCYISIGFYRVIINEMVTKKMYKRYTLQDTLDSEKRNLFTCIINFRW